MTLITKIRFDTIFLRGKNENKDWIQEVYSLDEKVHDICPMRRYDVIL